MGTNEKKEITAQSITEHLKEAEANNTKKLLVNDKRLYIKFKKQIDKAYENMEKSYFDTASAIHAIYTKQLYKIDNFKNIYDFAKQNYNIARGTTSNFINICDKFGQVNENGTVIGILPAYDAYSVSKLAVMLKFPKELLDKCNPEMSVRELKKLGKEYEENLIAEEISDDAFDIPDDIVDEPEKNVPINEPEKADIEESDNKVFVCQAKTIEELLSLQDLIADTLRDIREGNGKENAVINVSIQF